MDTVLAWDRQLLLALNGSDSLFADCFMRTLSVTSTWIFLGLALLYVVIKNSQWRQVLLFIIAFVLLLVLTDQISASIIKPYFHRFRPTHEPSLEGLVQCVHGHRGGMYGFVSSHAANVFGLFTFISLLLRSRLWTFAMFLWAFLIGVSRIYLGMHYPGDVLCGAVLGVLIGGIVYVLYSWANTKLLGERTYFSTAYTSTGYLIGDIHILMLALMLSYIYVLFRSIWLTMTY